MNKVFLLIFCLILASDGLGQKTPQPAKKSSPTKATSQTTKKPVAKSAQPKAGSAFTASKTPVKKPTPPPAVIPDPEVDKARFDAAVAAGSNAEKARLLRIFLDEFPNSELRDEAFVYLVTARAVNGSEKLQAADIVDAIASFKLAVKEAPIPTPDRLFEDVVSKIPSTLFYQGHRGPAMELAAAIEKKYANDARRLLSMAGFYLSIENGDEARRVAETAIAAQPTSAAGYQALGLAHRLNFDLEESSNAYLKALELDVTNVSAKRSLAEMKRALGESEEAAAIYRDLLSSNGNDVMSHNGLILSLFGSNQRAEAEAELAASLARSPRNFTLLAAVGYWYAAQNLSDKAVEYAQKAVDAEPRYIWGHIALARGLMKSNRPVDAERALIKARQYGNFPTLEYEIASARFKAGLYREAIEGLQKSFVLRDGMLETRLGGRVFKSAKSFQELLAPERKASILEPLAADDAAASARMHTLFEMTARLNSNSDENSIVELADDFVKGDDKMKLHRQLHAADLLLQKNIAVAKAAELVKAAVGNADAGLEVSSPAAAVMASELYESRTVAFARNEIVLIPDVPRQMLSSILRGRIEELAGWAFYQQQDYPSAVIRLRRAISVMPDKSAWWRSSMWRLGTALEADGKDKEALESYIQSYKIDRPSPVRYGVIESLYRKVNGSTDGLEQKIGPNPMPTVAYVSPPPPAGQKKELTKAERSVPQETLSRPSEPPAGENIQTAQPEAEKSTASIESSEQPKAVSDATVKENTATEPTAKTKPPIDHPTFKPEATKVAESAPPDLSALKENVTAKVADKEPIAKSTENAKEEASAKTVSEGRETKLPESPIVKANVEPVKTSADQSTAGTNPSDTKTVEIKEEKTEPSLITDTRQPSVKIENAPPIVAKEDEKAENPPSEVKSTTPVESADKNEPENILRDPFGQQAEKKVTHIEPEKGHSYRIGKRTR